MVGVPGGSRGCANCKKRKIKKQRLGRSAGAPDRDPVGTRLRNLLTTDDERRINGDEVEIRSRTLPSLLFEQPIQKQLRAFNSTSIPRELVLFPEYDLYNYCIKIFLDNFSMGSYPHRFGDQIDRTWVEVIPQFVMSSVPSSTTFTSRALVISHCGASYQDPDIALLASNWYVQALRHQKELVNIVTSDRGCTSRKRHYSNPAPDNNGAAEQDSILPSSQPVSTSNTRPSSPYQDLIRWAHSDTASVPKPSKDSILLPENSSMPLDLPVLTPGRNVSSMRGNFMSHEDDSITAGMLLCIYEVLNCSSDSPWISLLSGANELMRMRGPEPFRTGFNRIIFQNIRGLMAVQAMVTRKRTFLNDTEWKTVPWQYSSSEKPIQQFLLDLILEVPEHQDIINRFLKGSAAANDEVGPEEPGPMNQTSLLRKNCCTREMWAELRGTHKKLVDLDARFEKWFEEYSEGARDYARKHLHIPPTVEYDPLTGAPIIPTSRCPATMSDQEYTATHFFRPSVKYATLHDAQVVMMYLASRMVIAYLQELTFSFAYLDFEDSLGPKPGKRHPEASAYLEYKTSYMHDLARAICRTGSYMLSSASNIAILNMIFPFRIAHSVMQDPLERGWIWNELRRMHDMGIRLSLADLNGESKVKVCHRCGEHVRPLQQWYDVVDIHLDITPP
ncbi:hypothetical protein POJ06DRAFT_287352 [Lipomyces tetrasporus]|uniref:Uncharacterized protein n=1 Tax=Lipomyces tetrasporus TaxID=54092 RepID=A0AAD7QJW8_9ASCO|nr:uncharacterized protein POJ06DRAFT_287352 [Lipomyces tetrasporus]KAJ8096559.1 hypothetical protein POJ06DRAFT_287352 [Lipomyces tetrasporus]